MYSAAVRRQALDLISSGSSLRSISIATGISRTTLREWHGNPEKAQATRAHCPRCGDDPAPPEPPADYAYLLGLYLGDGCISVGGNPAKGVWKLRVICADAWPGLVEECVRAMQTIRPTSKVMLQQKQGCQEVSSYSRHWPCLFPQHGLGKKHLRQIELQEWQQTTVAEFAGEFVRGLFHSDGYRGMNRVRRVLADGEHLYEYPRYLFVNMSKDILQLCGQTLDRLDVEWRFSKPTTISVAKKEAVARLDAFVGPKY
jgi:hypothetical protein